MRECALAHSFLEVRSPLRRIPASNHALHIGDRHEGVRVFCLDIVHKLAIFLLCEDRQDLILRVIAVAAGGGVDGDAALESLDDVAFKIVVVFGDDAHADFSGELVDKVVQDKAAEVGGQSAGDHGLEVVGEVGACNGHEACDNDGLSEVHVKVLVHDLCDDVETAGGGVGVEEDRLSVADHDDHAHNIQGDISRRGCRIREQELEHEEERRQQDGDKDDLCPEGLINKEKRQDDADDIQEQRHGGQGQWDEVHKNHGETGDTSADDVVRVHKEVDSHGDDEGAEEDRGEIF